MIINKDIVVPIFKFVVKVVIFDNIEEVRQDKDYRRYFTNNEAAVTLKWSENSSICKIIIPRNNISVAVHEIEHVKNLIWKHIEYEPTNNNDEVDAYLLEYLTEKILKLIEKDKK